MAYEPKLLPRWTRPKNWFGTEWPAYYVFLGRTRDSDAMERSNFICALIELRGETDTVKIVRERHFLCGWIEWIAIHESDSKALETADKALEALEDYPVLNDEHFSDLEHEEASETWEGCYSDSERVEYIRNNRGYFYFNDFKELMACARGRCFCGSASDLLH